MTERRCEVAVLGAGASGLAAAGRLIQAGKRVQVIEARDRLGGRVWTVKPPGAPAPIELGAEFVHGRPESTWELIERERLRVVELPDAHYRPGPDPVDYWERLEAALGKLKATKKDRSFDEALAGMRLSKDDARRARDFVEGFHAADASRISANDLAAMNELEDEDRMFRLVDGYSGLIDALASRVPPSALMLEAPAALVKWDARGVVVETARGRVRAERLVVALPLGVLKTGGVRFDPEPRELRRALDGLESGSVARVTLVFSRRLWEEKAGDALMFHLPGASMPVMWTLRPEVAPVLTGWAGGPRSRALLAAGPAALAAEAMASLARVLEVNRDRVENALVSSHTHDWDADPYARGAYSWCAVGGAPARKALARPVAGRLFFAGEWLDAEGQNGTVAGALAAGIRAASAALRA